MSKGPGKIERAIVRMIPDIGVAMTVQEICARVYNIPYYDIEHRHRSAVLRAANNIIKRGGSYAWYAPYATGRRHRPRVLFSLDDVWGYVQAKLLIDRYYRRAPLTLFLSQDDIERLSQPGAEWWLEYDRYRKAQC